MDSRAAGFAKSRRIGTFIKRQYIFEQSCELSTLCTAHGKSYGGCENCHKPDIVLKVVNFSGNILLVPCQTVHYIWATSK